MTDFPAAPAGAVQVPRPFDLHGRIGRVRYLAYSFGAMIVLLLAAIVLGALLGAIGAGPAVAAGLMQVLVGTLMAAANLVIARRRLHDMGKSGWWGVLLLVPLLNIVVTLWLALGKGDEGPNAFGPPPSPNSRAVIALACIGPALFVGMVVYSAVDAYKTFGERTRSANSRVF
ncbi:DUF805 domain-containing protein [Pseudoduganella chitinolytica]|uniref:DUF805 domain-containing protein n=1 Tax=Pseudoduganella chitinolytica TaxID=34070 RepID=A0ABY8B9U5_9BURK|nr:DUF805 domain-containing protein [Pseudoduganella chitinolytica]WEF32700.1 DUF805 domain-containing protein [Pseudoduganella chitinolytica]